MYTFIPGVTARAEVITRRDAAWVTDAKPLGWLSAHPLLAKADPLHGAGVWRGQAESICWALTLTILLQLLRVLGVGVVALLPAQRRREEVFSNHPFPDGAKTFTANFQIPAQPAYAREPSLWQHTGMACVQSHPSTRGAMGGDGLVVLSAWQEPGQSPARAGEAEAQYSHRTPTLGPTCGQSSPSLCDWSCRALPTGEGESSVAEQPPNPALKPSSLKSQYLKQTIAITTTTMTNTSPAVAEPTIRGSSWKVLLVEPDEVTSRN